MKTRKRICLALLSLAMTAATVGAIAACGDEKTVYTVTFEYGYGEQPSTAQKVAEGGNVQQPSNPKREGYVFEGWYIKNADGSWSDEKFDFVGEKVAGGVVLYAKWSEEKKDKPEAPVLCEITFTDGVISVESEENCEYSFNGSEYADANTYECGYAARVKVEVRTKETEDFAPSEALVRYYTSRPRSEIFQIAQTENVLNSVTVTAGDENEYEYLFKGATDWGKGPRFDDLVSEETQTVKIRVCADGEYPESEETEVSFQVKVDKDSDRAELRVSHHTAWGGSDTHSTISTNTAAEGLFGTDEDNIRSIKIEDKDITQYNSWVVNMSGCIAFSADVKIVLNQTATDVAAFEELSVPITDDAGKHVGALEVGKWQKLYSDTTSWAICFGFEKLAVGYEGVYQKPTGTATVYLDNLKLYTQTDKDAGVLPKALSYVDETDGAGLRLTTAGTATLEKETLWNGGYTNRYKLSFSGQNPNDEATHHNHAITLKNTSLTDISAYGGISFALDIKTWTNNIRHAFYLVPKSQVATTTAELLDSYYGLRESAAGKGLIKLGSTYKATLPNLSAGTQILKITAAELEAAGYDLKNLTDVTIAFRDSVWTMDTDIANASGSQWTFMAEMYLWDFKLY